MSRQTGKGSLCSTKTEGSSLRMILGFSILALGLQIQVSQEAASRGVTNGDVRPPGPNRPKWAQSVPNGPILNFPIFGPFSHKS